MASPEITSRWEYRVPSSESGAELKVQGSRFIALIFPAVSAESAQACLRSVKKKYHDATHHCWAYRIGWGDGLSERSSDDGEPSKTAGLPILSSLTKYGVSDALAVVVRYFGGIKLGTAGLARAYRDSADLALQGAALDPRSRMSRLDLSAPYHLQGPLRLAIKRYGAKVVSEEFGAGWDAEIELPSAVKGELEADLLRLSEESGGVLKWAWK